MKKPWDPLKMISWNFKNPLDHTKTLLTHFQIVQMNKSPLTLTFVGSETCNTGHILSLENEVDKYLEEYKLAVLDNQML